MPWTDNTSPFLYPNPFSLMLKSIIDPPAPTRASIFKPVPIALPVTDRFVYPVAMPTFITGGNCALYPLPPLVTLIPVIIPALLPVPTVAAKTAAVPVPNGLRTSTFTDPEK